MGKITIHNYVFPIQFTHKGWKVEIYDETVFFSMKDIKIKAKIEVASESYAHFIATQYVKTKQIEIITKSKRLDSSRFDKTQEEEYQKIYQEAYNHYSKLAKEYAVKRKIIQKTFAVNGGIIDRFFGQNISATEKATQLVIDYIDNNLGDAWKGFLNYIGNIYKK